MQPNNIYQIEIDLWTTCYIFNPGHSLELAISSSNYPRFSVNPNNGNAHVRDEGPKLVALNSVFVGGKTPSQIVLPLVDLDQIPDNVL